MTRGNMRGFGVKLSRWPKTVLFGALMLVCLAGARGQQTAAISGYVRNPVGQPLANGDVKLSTDRTSPAKDRKFQYEFPINSSGNFGGVGIAPGNYVAVVFQNGVSVDFIDNLNLVAGEETSANFDMSRKEYIDKMTPEERKSLEEYKARSDAAILSNANIQNANALLLQARASIKAEKYNDAVDALKQATKLKPDAAILWLTLGDASLGQARSMAKWIESLYQDHKANQAPMVRDIYLEAADAYRKTIELSVTTEKVGPEVVAAAYDGLGQAFARTGDVKSASGSFDEAAKAQPANAGMHYFNEAATLYNVYEENGKRDPTMAAAAEVAAEKAIAAQSTNPFAYYIKAEGLALRMTTAGGRYVAPPGLVEACNKYMELGTPGPRMDDVKGMLAKIDQPVAARSRK